MNPVDMMTYGQRQVMEVIGRLRADDWQRIALGVWTSKDLVGHLGAFEVRFSEAIAPFAGEEPRTALLRESPATFNDQQAAIRADWPVDRVLAEFEQAHALVMDLARLIPAEVWPTVGTIAWYGPEYSMDDLLVYQVYGHKREHIPQLQAVTEHDSA